MNTDKPWYIVDATDKILGRLASTIAIYIRGKNLATYTPSVDMGAFVIVVCNYGCDQYGFSIHFWCMRSKSCQSCPVTNPISLWSLGCKMLMPFHFN